MEYFKLSDSDIDWIDRFYPALKIGKNSIDGEISFKRNYQGVELEDSYLISIDLQKYQSSILPKVKETGNMLNQFSKDNKLPLADLHINPDNSFCLTIQPEEERFFTDGIFNWKEFFQNALVPFLFQQSYFKKYKRFPWGEYAHGYLAYLELYADGKIQLYNIPELYLFQIYQLLEYKEKTCICGSKKQFHKCHSKVYQGLKRLKKLLIPIQRKKKTLK